MSELAPKAQVPGPSAPDVPVTDPGRRAILVGATTVLVVASIDGQMPVCAADPPADADVETFVELSAALTGVAKGKLMPRVDEQDVKRDYFVWLRDRAQPTFGKILQLVQGKPPADIPKIISESGAADADIRYLLRSITLLWYLGTWYAPARLRAQAEAADPGTIDLEPQIVSAKAYKNGWVWRVAQAHPMGYSDMQFGYWAEPPADKKFFIGGQ